MGIQGPSKVKVEWVKVGWGQSVEAIGGGNRWIYIWITRAGDAKIKVAGLSDKYLWLSLLVMIRAERPRAEHVPIHSYIAISQTVLYRKQ
jgi:hypothetical protein